MKRNIINIAAVVAVLVAGAGTAFADVDSSTVNTQTATLSFGASSIASHTLTPVSDLPLNLATNQTVANGSVTINGDQNINYVALQWTPDYDGQTPTQGNSSEATISGKNDNSHKLALAFTFPSGSSAVQGTQWRVPVGLNTGDMTYVVTSQSATTVPADSYTISMDAAIFVK